MRSYSKNRFVCGVGVNDADYNVNEHEVLNGIHFISWRCPFYRKWKDMITRCYSKAYQKKHPTYIGCIVCDEWLKFSNFKAWMEKQDWEDKDLDKDLLKKGNKVYSPESCCFIDKKINYFTIEQASSKGALPIGVSLHKASGKLLAQCRNPISNKNEYLGVFDCPQEAHQAWRKRKHEFACQLADMQTDERVANALRLRYAPA